MTKEIVKRLVDRIERLSTFTDEPGTLTRTIFSPSMRSTLDEVRSWMEAAGMEVLEDAMGNIKGLRRSSAGDGDVKTLLIGSHLDTVRNAGKYDGVLGVLLGLASVERLGSMGVSLPFDIEVAGFVDEEGWRFKTGYLACDYFTGTWDESLLDRTDVDNVSLGDAMRTWGIDRSSIQAPVIHDEDYWGYLEAHIEQGPRLESLDLPVGVVASIAGQTRATVTFKGKAGHAGTTPMNLRKDALAAGASFVLGVEEVGQGTEDLVATVGFLEVQPNVSNVIPAEVSMSLDLRHPDDEVREQKVAALQKSAETIARARGLESTWTQTLDEPAVPCSAGMAGHLEACVIQKLSSCPVMVSGAGHDAVALARVMPVALLFIRCREGLSHHPDEYASPEDIEAGLDVIVDFILRSAEHRCHESL